MTKDKKLVTVDDCIASTVQFNKEVYIQTETGIRLRDDILEKVYAAAKQRWENGGKEIHDKWMADPAFAETKEFKKYMAD